MKVLIVAGGLSSRLWPLAVSVPKVLLPINGQPLLHRIFRFCEKAYLSEFIICTTRDLVPQFKDAISSYMSQTSTIKFCTSPKDYNTAGRILAAKDLVGDDPKFVVYYGDILARLFLFDMVNNHTRTGAVCTVAVAPKQLEYGVVETKSEMIGSDIVNRVTNFIEKPMLSKISTVKANVGIAVCSPEIFSYCKPQDSFFGVTVPSLLKAKKHVYAYDSEGYIDVGNFQNYNSAQRDFKLFT